MRLPQTTNSIIAIHRQDKNYPIRLNDLYDPPKVLYIYGDIALLHQPMIAIVGSRTASIRGMENASVFAKALSKAGLVVLSGMARGIDGAAHQATLGLDHGLTMAVCGTGIDVVYPREHANLANDIAKRGLLLSEFPPGTGPKPFHFPRRNRLIAALALGVVVIEAVFVYPGLGQLMVDAVSKRDVPVIQACGLVFATVFVLLNTLADILVILVNPRLRHQR